MQTFSRTTILGYVGSVDVRKTTMGQDVVTVSVATTKRWLPKSEQKKPKEEQKWESRSTWHRVVFFGDYWFSRASTLEKGDPVYIEAELDLRQYEDKEGIKRLAVQFKPLSLNVLKKSERTFNMSEEGEDYYDRALHPSRSQDDPDLGPSSFDDEDIPF